MAVFMPETLKLSKTLKSSREDFNVKYNTVFILDVKVDFNVLGNFNVSSINASNEILADKILRS